LIVFRAGTYIPVPGVDPAALASFFDQQAGNMLALFNLFSGGALSRFGIFALGIMPYISSSIIMQMASMIVPSLQVPVDCGSILVAEPTGCGRQPGVDIPDHSMHYARNRHHVSDVAW
jgi:hypothetical protein